MSKFGRKLRPKSVSVYELSDIDRMRNYQSGLIDYLVYVKHADKAKEQFMKDKILFEIKQVEKWLFRETKIFVEDNNRRFVC